ncbi:hypothetical protein PENSPDRAFT_578057 [Peniophora sp. CONT]|nr:hypothetical protein PENSPDRAFT_578057 [Peniophora sp. CONT]
MTHPYARIYAKKQAEAGKRRKTWNHALEKSIFTPHEIATMGAPNRRTIYQASLEAYVDQLHEKLLANKLFPVPLDDLKPWEGLNNKTARSMVAGLQHDSTLMKQKLKELERLVRFVLSLFGVITRLIGP